MRLFQFDCGSSPVSFLRLNRFIAAAGPSFMITSTASDASECVWVTKTTFGEVEYTVGAVPVKYPGAATLALQVRNSVEVRSS